MIAGSSHSQVKYCCIHYFGVCSRDDVDISEVLERFAAPLQVIRGGDEDHC